jgi:membrane protein DedA with SNARE-associated domain
MRSKDGNCHKEELSQGEMPFSVINPLILGDQNWLAKLGGAIGAAISSLGGFGVLILAVGDSSFLTLPEGNDLLIVILSAGNSWGNMAYYVGMTVLGSVIGCLLLYTVGRKGGSPILRRKFSQHKIDRAEMLFKKYGIMTVVIPSILPPPLPFKIFVLSAGVFRLNVMKFLAAIVIGRTIRYSMWGILAVLYGNSFKRYMQQNLDSIGTILLALFGLVVVAVFGFYLYRVKSQKKRNCV